jgi:hypothetical protein
LRDQHPAQIAGLPTWGEVSIMVATSPVRPALAFTSATERRTIGQGRYSIEDVLLAGGGRALLVGRPQGMQQTVLIERITGLSAAALRRAMSRASTLLSLAHPNLARAIDCFVEDSALHIVMVTGPGAPLSDPRGLVGQDAAIAIGTQLCNALGYIAWRGITTMPAIAPTTVFLTTAGRVKLTNLAALLGVRIPRRTASAQAAPLAGVGATLRHLLAGTGHRASAPVDLTALRPDLSAELCAALGRAIEPTNGWRSAAEMRYALLQIPHSDGHGW